MSSENTSIRIKGLSKRYEIYEHPGDRLKQFIASKLARLTGSELKKYYKDFWALKDVSFEIKKGETFGIIGRNGAGKSTLLQLICGTLSPTAGMVEVNGRVAALLELGSGFNMDFTGRENVYLNASVLGLSATQIADRFSDIEKFAAIGEFIDQPVKTYSSGMLVRLAFAVIAHVDADILVVDEALSVGDVVFNQKCMRFIRNFQKVGTLIFVSHDISAVNNICDSAMWLNEGHIASIGPVKKVSEDYAKFTAQQIYGDSVELSDANIGHKKTLNNIHSEDVLNYQSQYLIDDNLSEANGWKTGHAFITKVELARLDLEPSDVLMGGESVRLKIEGKAVNGLDRPILGFLLRDRLGQDIFGENTLAFTSLNPVYLGAGESIQGIFEFTLPMLPNGEYSLMVSIADGDSLSNVQHHWLHDALILRVNNSKVRYGLAGIKFHNVSMGIKK